MKLHRILQDLRLQSKVYSRSLFPWNSKQCNIPERVYILLFQIAIALIMKCNNTFLCRSMRNVLTHFVQPVTNECQQIQFLSAIITIQSVYCYE
jgi:hypothetical protein